MEADVYDAPDAVPKPHGFDLVFVTWGAICWLPDIRAWAKVVAAMLRPGGALYLAEAHPAAYVLDDAKRSADGMPGFFAPYFSGDPVVMIRRSATTSIPRRRSRIRRAIPGFTRSATW